MAIELVKEKIKNLKIGERFKFTDRRCATCADCINMILEGKVHSHIYYTVVQGCEFGKYKEGRVHMIYLKSQKEIEVTIVNELAKEVWL